jgi:hypothetical protein
MLRGTRLIHINVYNKVIKCGGVYIKLINEKLATRSIQIEDIQLRVPCNEQMYDEGLASDAPLLDCFQPGMGIQSLDLESRSPSPAAYMMVIASLYTDVTNLIFRRPYQTAGPGSYVKSHESSLSDI